MKKSIYILLVTSLIFMISCEDKLDLGPQQSISIDKAISNPSNLKSLLKGVYDECGQSATYGGQTQIIADLLGNISDLSWYGTFVDPRQLHRKSVLVSNGFVSGNWNNNYEVINQANLIIDNIGLFEDISEKNRVEGEAKFLRAMAYFDLIRNFSKQYNEATASSDLGVPLRLKGIIDYTGDLSISRSSVKQVYDQIILDLRSAESLLPSNNSFFADTYAAKALLSRVYLQQGKYPEARDLANDVINNSGKVLSERYSDVFNNDKNSTEDIFAFQVTDQSGNNNLITFYATEENGGRGGDIAVNGAFVGSFDSANDARRSFFNFNGFGDRLTNKYTNQFGNIPVLRLSEMYLTRAEANHRESTSLGDSPLNDINKIRRRSNATDLTSVDLNLILRERHFELAFEGFLLHDLKRTSRNIGSISWSADRLVLPIPQSEMDSNSKMVQNPGYVN